MPVDLCFILGGSRRREIAALKTANQRFPDVPIWISGPEISDDFMDVIKEEGINPDLVRIDYRAIDTVSNFTTLSQEIHQGGFKKVAILTSRYHMTRARAIAAIIFPHFNLKYVPFAIVYKADDERENQLRVWRDQIRAYLFVYLGYDVTQKLAEWYHKDRFEAMEHRVDTLTFYGHDAHVSKFQQ